MYYNDAILVVGVKGDKIDWVEPVTLSKSAEFKVHTSDITDNFNDLVSKFDEVIGNHWEKVILEDYSYLAGDIELPLWYEIIIIIINIVGSFFVFRYMFKHEL